MIGETLTLGWKAVPLIFELFPEDKEPCDLNEYFKSLSGVSVSDFISAFNKLPFLIRNEYYKKTPFESRAEITAKEFAALIDWSKPISGANYEWDETTFTYAELENRCQNLRAFRPKVIRNPSPSAKRGVCKIQTLWELFRASHKSLGDFVIEFNEYSLKQRMGVLDTTGSLPVEVDATVLSSVIFNQRFVTINAEGQLDLTPVAPLEKTARMVKIEYGASFTSPRYGHTSRSSPSLSPKDKV